MTTCIMCTTSRELPTLAAVLHTRVVYYTLALALLAALSIRNGGWVKPQGIKHKPDK